MALPKPDPLKPQPGRREPGARSVRGPKLAEDLTVTAAAHTLDGHAGSLTKSRLNSTTLVEEGNGVPTHTAERSTQYQDLDTNKVYINADGATTWVEIGTGAAATTFLGLTDTPASYAGQALKVTRVNAGETALEFAAASGAALTVQEEDGTPIDTAVTIIRVPNGGLTDNGTGDVSLGYELAGAVTTHAGAADPHTGYRLESANHSHISTGLQAGQLTVAALSDAPAGELGGTWASPTVDANHAAGVYHEFNEIAAPGAGSANKLRVYAIDVAGVTALGLVDSAGVAVAIRPVDWTDLTDGGATTLHSHAVMVQTVNFVIDGGGSAITTGVKGDLVIDYACTINSATLLADQSGSIVIDIWKDSYANFPPTVADTITASAKPTLSGAQKSQDTTLTGWTTSIAAGETLRFNVDSVATVQRVTLSLKVTRT